MANIANITNTVKKFEGRKLSMLAAYLRLATDRAIDIIPKNPIFSGVVNRSATVGSADVRVYISARAGIVTSVVAVVERWVDGEFVIEGS